MTPFSLLGLPERFGLSAEEVEEAWRRAIALVHPDRFAGRSAAERLVAEQWSGRINEAKAALASPVARAGALLEIRGVDIGTETDTHMDMDFLMLQMEWRERAGEASAAGDAAALAAVLHDIGRERAALLEKLELALDGVPPDNAAAREAVRRLMFVEKIRTTIEGLSGAGRKEKL